MHVSTVMCYYRCCDNNHHITVCEVLNILDLLQILAIQVSFSELAYTSGRASFSDRFRHIRYSGICVTSDVLCML